MKKIPIYVALDFKPVSRGMNLFASNADWISALGILTISKALRANHVIQITLGSKEAVLEFDETLYPL